MSHNEVAEMMKKVANLNSRDVTSRFFVIFRL